MIGWYYKLGTKQAGPVSSEELVELAKVGAVRQETKLWHAGMTSWTRAASVSELQLFFPEAPTDQQQNVLDPSLAGPWPRLWARLLDVYILTVVIGGAVVVLAEFYLPSLFFKLVSLPSVALDVLFLPLASVATALMMRVTGTTIGKALVGIKVQNLSGPNTLFFLLKREFKVWIFGLGFGIPLINLLTMINQHQQMSKKGSADYDQGIARVIGGRSQVRCTVAAIAFAAVFASVWYLGTVEESAQRDVKITQDWTNPATGDNTFISKTWAFKDLESEFGSAFYFSSDQLLAEMVLGYEPLDQDGIDPLAYGEALQEALSDELHLTSEWKPVEVAGVKAMRATAVHKTATDVNVEITVSIVGKSAWRLLVYVSGRPTNQFIEGKAAAQSLFSTIKDINIPTDLPCEGGRCV